MKICLISGSLRQDSFNTRLLLQLADTLAPGMQGDFLNPSDMRLPLFDEDLENDPATLALVTPWHARVASATGVLIACPEYNGQPTAFLKNLVDWITRLPYLDQAYANPFAGKPVLLCSASTGWSGGALGLVHARALLAYVGATVIAPTVCVPYAPQAWSDLGYAFSPTQEATAEYALAQWTALCHASAVG